MIRIHRTGATILKWGLFITCIGTVMYPIAIGPMINPSKYSKWFRLECISKIIEIK